MGLFVDGRGLGDDGALRFDVTRPKNGNWFCPFDGTSVSGQPARSSEKWVLPPERRSPNRHEQVISCELAESGVRRSDSAKTCLARRILLAVCALSALMRPRMSIAYQIIVCGSNVPDPLQTLEPVTGPAGPALKNEMMLPAILDPWASHALYEAANLTKNSPGSKVWLVSLGPKAKLQQVMMTVAQKVAVRTRRARRPGQRIHRGRGGRRRPRRCHSGHPRSRQVEAARVRRLGIRVARAAAPPCRWSANASASPTSSRRG